MAYKAISMIEQHPKSKQMIGNRKLNKQGRPEKGEGIRTDFDMIK